MTRWAAILLIAAFVGPVQSRTVFAQEARQRAALTEAQKVEAQSAFEAGRKAYNLQKYHSAAAHFAKSYEVSGNPDLLFNIAQAYRLAGSNEQAIAAYKSFLREVPGSPNRQVAESKLGQLQILALKPPEHANGAAVAPSADPVLTTSDEMLATHEAAKSESGRLQWLPWAGVGATSAFFIGAVATGANARGKFRTLRDTCGQIGTCTDDQIASVNSTARWATAFWILTGLAAVGTGAAFYIDVHDRTNAMANFAGRF